MTARITEYEDGDARGVRLEGCFDADDARLIEAVCREVGARAAPSSWIFRRSHTSTKRARTPFVACATRTS